MTSTFIKSNIQTATKPDERENSFGFSILQKGRLGYERRCTYYDHESGRMDIRFDLLDYYGGLHCGEPLEVKIGDVWVPTTIELGDFWYLKGIYIAKLNGLHVRIKD